MEILGWMNNGEVGGLESQWWKWVVMVQKTGLDGWPAHGGS